MIDSKLLIGLVAGTLTTAAFVPQVIKTIKLRETKDISLLMYAIFCIGLVLWLTYGIINQDLAIILANSITLVLSLIVLSFKIKYG